MDRVLPLILIAAVFVVLIILPYRRQAQKQRDVQSMQATLEPGARVMTTSGLHGTVVTVDDQLVDLEIADGVVVRYARAAVGQVLSPAPAGDEPEQETHDEAEPEQAAHHDDESEDTSRGTSTD